MRRAFIIAEIGQAHDGSLGILHSYIDALADTGIDAIKFQIHIAEAESSSAEPFRVPFSYEDDSRFAYWKRMSFTQQQWAQIKRHCVDVGVEFMASPFSLAAVDLLEALEVQRYKIGSGEIRNFLLLDYIAQTGKPMILSSGLGTYDDLDHALVDLENYPSDVAILQCTTQYPTKADNIGLNVITELIERYPSRIIGFSDHSARIETCQAARVLGAEILEVHAVFDRSMFGPDATSSLTPGEIRKMINGVRFIEQCLSHPVDKSQFSGDPNLIKIFGKSLAVNCDLPAGTILTKEHLETKKPAGEGIAAELFASVLGKKLRVAKKKYDFLVNEDLLET